MEQRSWESLPKGAKLYACGIVCEFMDKEVSSVIPDYRQINF